MNMIDQAIHFAARAHHNQYRKASNTPYIAHPFAVGMTLMKAGCSEEVIAAGILHDVVEDTEVSLRQLRVQFGRTVADIVEGCSEPDKSLSWEDRKQHTIDYIKTAPLSVKLVVCADKLHNISSIQEEYKEHGAKIWRRFNRGKQQQSWYYHQVVSNLHHGLPGEKREAFIFRELKERVETFF